MYLTATSTDFLLLSQKVEALGHFFDYLIPGITLTITLLLALFVSIQFIYSRRLQKEDVQKLREEITAAKVESSKTIEQTLDEKADSLRTWMESNSQELRELINTTRTSAEADINRIYAITSEGKNFYVTALSWWLSAAMAYSSVDGAENLFDISISSALSALDKIKPQDSKELLKKADDFEPMIKTIEIKKPIMAKALREKIAARCEEQPKSIVSSVDRALE